MSILRARVCVAGEPTVGKTSLVRQAVLQRFDINYEMTQGCEYHIKEVQTNEKDQYRRTELHLIDIAG